MDWRRWPWSREARSTGGTRRQSADDFLTWLMGPMAASAADVVVTTDVALTVPAVWSAVNFLSGTIAGLPLKVFRKTPEGREEVSGALADMLHYAPNPQCSSFEWRKHLFDCVFTGGRGLAWIERSSAGTPLHIWGLEPEKVVVERLADGRKVYHYRDTATRQITYAAADVIDVPFMLYPDGLRHRGPINMGRDAIGLAVAATQYGSKFLANGGVPPFAVTGPFQSTAAMQRAADDMHEAVRKSAKEKRQALTLPPGLEIKSIGADPDKSQLVELQRWCVEQVARLYNLPPVFLQDLTHGTFSNTEQQDLHFAKHTVKRWVEQFEQEVNLKLWGPRSNSRYIEFSLDGLLRGDFKTRIDGYASAIQHGIYTPAEVRTMENRPEIASSNRLFLQGAMVPLDQAGARQAPPPPAGDEANAD